MGARHLIRPYLSVLAERSPTSFTVMSLYAARHEASSDTPRPYTRVDFIGPHVSGSSENVSPRFLAIIVTE